MPTKKTTAEQGLQQKIKVLTKLLMPAAKPKRL